MKKILKILGLTVPLLAATGIEIAVSIFAIFTYYAVYFMGGLYRFFILQDQTMSIDYLMANIPYPGAVIEYILYMMQIMWAITFFFWYKKVKINPVGPKVKLLQVKNLILIIVLGMGLNLATSGLLQLVLPHFEKLMEQYTELMSTVFEGNPVLVFISTVVFAPIAEELIFRGVIMQKALKFAPFAVANLLQALLFGIYHMNIVQGVYAFAGGLAMGYVAYKFKTIWASILLHAVYNGVGGYLLFDPGQQWLYVYVIAGLILVGLSITLINKIKAKPQNNPVSAELE